MQVSSKSKDSYVDTAVEFKVSTFQKEINDSYVDIAVEFKVSAF